MIVRLVICLFVCFVGLSSSIQSASKTLPKGMWHFSSSSEFLDVDEIAGETINPDGSGNGDFRYVSVVDYTAKFISAFQPLIQGSLISPEMQLLDSARELKFYFDFGYGITDKLSIFVNIPYVDRRINYSDDYISTFEGLDQAAEGGAIPGMTGDDFTVPPDQAVGSGFGDTTVSLKYNVVEDLALGLGYRGSFLKTGTDATEISKGDGFEELATGSDGSSVIYKIYYDLRLGKALLNIKAKYFTYSQRQEKILDTDFEVRDASEIYLDMYSNFNLLEKLSIKLGMQYKYAGEDQQLVGGSWENINDSGVSALLGEVGFTYMPYRFLRFWTSAQFPLSAKPSGGVYEYPGRLNLTLIKFGVNLFVR